MIASASSILAETIVIQDAQLRLVDDVLVSAQDAGIVKQVPIEPNDNVKQDDLLTELDNDIQMTQVRAAQKQLAIAREESTNDINLRYAKKTAEVAQKELERARAAASKYARAVSVTELEQLELQMQQSVLSGEQASHEMTVNNLNTELKTSELDLAQIKLKQRQIQCPMDGQVAEVLVQKGQWVELGAPVVRVVSLDKLRVVALVPETHLFSVRHGQTARLNIIMGATVDENGDAKESVISAEGKVSFVSPEVNPVNREFLVWVDIDNRNRKLRPGLVGTLSIDSGSKSAEPLLTNN